MEATAQTLTIEGMTCDGCARSVRNALLELDGVLTAEANATAGTATFTSKHAIARDDLAAAIVDAGYELK